MLNPSKVIFWFLCVLIFQFLISCEPKKKDASEVGSTKMMQVSKRIISEKIDYEVFNYANDSVSYWIENSLQSYLYERGNNWRIDSLLCFNSQKDKCIMALLNQDRYPTSKNDGINVFYGVKIKDKWYFFKGPFVVLFRENYQKDIHTPLPFAKLHEIAMDNIFKGYLKKNEDGPSHGGKWEINEGFFKQLDYSEWGFFDTKGNVVDNSKLTQAQLDSHLLAKAVFSNWKHRDATNHQPLQ